MQFPKTETREIKILTALSHPNMVNLQEVVTSLHMDKGSRDALLADVDREQSFAEGGAPAAGGELLGLGERMGDVYMVFDYVDYDIAGLLHSGYK